jgi:hypothetical protein
MNQPTASVTTSWNINAGSSTVSGTFTFVGTDATASRIMQVAVTSGSFSVNGLVTYASNTTAANQVISVSTGTLTFGSLVMLSSGTMTLSSTGTINFNGGLTFGGANNPSFSTVASSNINFGGNLTATSTSLTLNATSNTTFTNSGTINPNANITFGNFAMNSGVTVTLADNIKVAGNWVNNNGTLNGGANRVTFTGANKTISGTTTTFPELRIEAGSIDTLKVNTSCTSLKLN